MPLSPAQIVTLKTEITTDPQALGLLTPYNAGEFGIVKSKLETLTSVRADRMNIPTSEILGAIVLSEYVNAAITTIHRVYLQTLLGCDVVRVTASVRQAIGTIFSLANAPNTRAALLALIDRPKTRAEVVLGTDVVVTIEDIAATRGV